MEAYKNFGIKSYKKSLSYITRIYSSQLEEGEKSYEKAHKVYSINVVTSFKEERKSLTDAYYKALNDYEALKSKYCGLEDQYVLLLKGEKGETGEAIFKTKIRMISNMLRENIPIKVISVVSGFDEESIKYISDEYDI